MDKSKLAEPKQVTKLTVIADKERMENEITVDQLIGFMEGDLKAIVEVLSNFVWDAENKVYYDYDVARKMIGKMTTKQLRQSADIFWQGAEEAVVPKVKEQTSDLP